MSLQTDDGITFRIEVDGIVGVAHRTDWTWQPMFDLRGDHHEHTAPDCRQMWNMPPTEAELNWWVKNADEEDEDWTVIPVDGPTL